MVDKENNMTREEKLWTMTAKTLQGVGEKLGVKITDSDIKKGKATIIAKIMAAEAEAPVEEVKEGVKEGVKEEAKEEVKTAPVAPVKTAETVEVVETKVVEKKAPKKANLKLTELTYKGETKSIKEWAAEIDMPWPTLYDRVNRNGWPVNLAIETPLGQRCRK